MTWARISIVRFRFRRPMLAGSQVGTTEATAESGTLPAFPSMKARSSPASDRRTSGLSRKATGTWWSPSRNVLRWRPE